MLRNWYRLVLKLVRHTPTYSPPVASRSFAYLGVIAYEAVASGSNALLSLAGQLNGLTPVPPRTAADVYSEAVVGLCRPRLGREDLLREHRPHGTARDGRRGGKAQQGGLGRG